MISYQLLTGTCAVKGIERLPCKQMASLPRKPMVSLSRDQVIILRVISTVTWKYATAKTVSQKRDQPRRAVDRYSQRVRRG